MRGSGRGLLQVLSGFLDRLIKTREVSARVASF